MPKFQTPNEDMDNLSNICCQIPGHQSKKISAFCIDKSCKEKIKFECFDCFFDNHLQHNMIKLDNLKKILNSKLKEYNSSKDEELIINKLKSEKKKEISNIIDSLKQKIIKLINDKFETFKEDVFKNYFDSDQKQNNFEKIQKYEKLAYSNAAPTNQNEIIELSQICSDIYIECDGKCNEKNINIEEIKNNCKKNLDNILQTFSKQFQIFSDNQIELMSNYLKDNFKFNNFMNNNKTFEWYDKEFQTNYGFLYNINKTKITKTESSGTITVVRGKDKLKNNYKYSIEFKICLKNGDDLDLGIGKEDAAIDCWLRNNNSCSITTNGIFNGSNNINGSFKLKDNDIVKIDVNMKDKIFKGFVNKKKVCNFNFQLDDIYIMAAIRNTGNWVEVISYDFSPI